MPRTTTLDHSQYDVPAKFKAPKARPIPAWGNAPCAGSQRAKGLKARSIHISIPQIPFIEFHSIFFEECAKFILKRLLPVMHFLAVDVIDQCTQISRSNRECSVTPLPRELRQLRRLSFEPLGRRRLKLFHQPRNVLRARQANRKMYVIGNSAYTKAFAFGVSGDGGQIRIKCITNGRIEKGDTILCAKNHMDQNERERLRHRLEYSSCLQPSSCKANRTWGFAPCWYKGAPLALSQFVNAALVLCLFLPLTAHAQSTPSLHIRVINAQTNKPITNERLNVAIKTDQIGSVAM